jgi:transcriptional enhancer factor
MLTAISICKHKKNIHMYSLLLFVFQQFWQPGLQPSTSQDVKPFAQPVYPGSGKTATAVSAIESNLQTQHSWEGRSIATQKFRLVEFSAYLDLNADEAVSDVS